MSASPKTEYFLLTGASVARPRAKTEPTNRPEYLNEQDARLLMNRLSRVEGHIRSVKEMVENQRPLEDIVLQVVAIKAALNTFVSVLIDHDLQTHLQVQNGTKEHLEKVISSIKLALKQS